ncbi:MAG: UDP-2,4-diacetamido-2,4,6-trideoxy-beta-L-altropyranose hydrolase [Steroidobacteraceae bacterium]
MFRVDGGQQIGSGHVVRCLTLASELSRRGAHANFICRNVAGHFAELIESAGFGVELLDANDDDAAATRKLLTQHAAQWLVVDHYGLDAAFESAQRDVVGRIMVLDDLADRLHDCDLLLDQNFHGTAGQRRYENLVPRPCRLLQGPRYALVQREYAMLREMLGPRGAPRRVLVFFGGSDATNETSKAVAALLQPEFAGLAVDVVVGRNHPDPEGIRALARERDGIVVHRPLGTLAGLMFRADVALGAGGTATWERLALELPTAVVTVADNQREFTAALASAGMVRWIGDAGQVTPSDYASALRSLLVAPAANAGLVDGLGAERVAAALLEPPSEATTTGAGVIVVVLAERSAWISESLHALREALRRSGHTVLIAHDAADAPPADVCILLSWGQIVDADFRARYRHTVVAHASDLPRGRGWSPLAWEISSGANCIVVSLIEATEKVDAGVIYLQETLNFEGHELLPEMQQVLGQVIERLCVTFATSCAHGTPSSREQSGVPSYHPRRSAADSELDPHATIAAQFDLLRVVDNARYPAYLDHRGHRYVLTIRKGKSPS